MVVLHFDVIIVAEEFSWNQAAISTAFSMLASPPASSVRFSSLETQPLRQISPSRWAASNSLSIRGLK